MRLFVSDDGRNMLACTGTEKTTGQKDLRLNQSDDKGAGRIDG